ncbi:uncharacterized protein LOC144912269 [Branchiostoma floridae x Branchiostoma belcheri]
MATLDMMTPQQAVAPAMSLTMGDIASRVSSDDTGKREMNLCRCDLVTVPLQVYQFKDVVTLDLSYNKIARITPDIADMRSLEVLLLKENLIKSLPLKMASLVKLRRADLSNNRLVKAVPEVLLGMNNLEELDLSGNQLTTFPEKPRLKRVTKLNLARNRFVSFPKAVLGMRALIELDVSFNTIREMTDDEECRMRFLKRLDVSHNELPFLPRFILDLKSLEVMDASANKLRRVSDGPCHLSKLRRINLSQNEFQSVPKIVSLLKGVEDIDISNNQMADWIVEGKVYGATSVKRLKMSDNKFETLPEIVEKLERLEVLDASNNAIKDMPYEIECSKRLRKLNLAGNKFVQIPAVVLTLVMLEELDMSNNHIADVADEECLMKRLKKVNIERNCLTSIPAFLLQRSKLIELDISDNKLFTTTPTGQAPKWGKLKTLCLQNNFLSSISDLLPNMAEIQELNVSNNNLSTLKGIKGRKRMRKVWLRNNQFEAFPKELTLLHELEELDLGENDIDWLPVDLKYLSKLRVLLVDGNNIEALPNAILEMAGLAMITVKDNPLRQPPIDVCNEGLPMIYEYVTEMKRTGIAQMPHHKVVVLGAPGSGKSSLVRTLLQSESHLTGEEYEPFYPENPTVPESHMWTFDEFEVELVDTSGFDFFTDRLVIPKNALYLVLFNAHEYVSSKYRQAIGNWLELLNARVPQCRVLLVGTHSDFCTAKDFAAKHVEIMARIQQQEQHLISELQTKVKDINDAMKSHSRLEPSNELYGLNREMLLERRQELEHFIRNRCSLPSKVFAVSSSPELAGLDDLANEIVGFMMKEKKPANSEAFPVPWSWRELYTVLRRHGEGRQVMTWDEVEEVARELTGLSGPKLEIAIRFLHHRRDIFWFGAEIESPILSDLLFPNPTQFFKVIKVIFLFLLRGDIEKLFDFNHPRFRSAGVRNISEDDFEDRKADFLKHGILDETILRFLWSQFGDLYGDILSGVIAVLQHLGLWYITTSRTDNRVMHVPWYFSDDAKATHYELFWPPRVPEDTEQLTIIFGFRQWYPTGFFEAASVCMQEYIDPVATRADWKDGVLATTPSRMRVYLGRRAAETSAVVELAMRGDSFEIDTMWTEILRIYRGVAALLTSWPGLRYDVYLVCPHCVKRNIDMPHMFYKEVLRQPRGKRRVICPRAAGGFVDAKLVFPPDEETGGLRRYVVNTPKTPAADIKPKMTTVIPQLDLGSGVEAVLQPDPLPSLLPLTAAVGEDRYREILMQHRATIIQDLNVRPLRDYLVQRKVLKPAEFQVILTELTNQDEAAKLIHMIMARGPRAFNVFCAALQRCGYPGLAAKLLRPIATKTELKVPSVRLKDQQSSLASMSGSVKDLSLGESTISPGISSSVHAPSTIGRLPMVNDYVAKSYDDKGIEAQHKLALQRHRLTIIRHLDVRDIRDYMLKNHAIKEADMAAILTQLTRQDEAAKLVDILSQRPEHAFPIFCKALQKYGYPALARQLTRPTHLPSVRARPMRGLPPRGRHYGTLPPWGNRKKVNMGARAMPFQASLGKRRGGGSITLGRLPPIDKTSSSWETVTSADVMDMSH